MSQLLACTHPSGLILAADRRVVATRGGQEEVHTIRKLFPLGPSAAVATSGAAVGIMVSRTLSRLLRRRREGLPFDDLATYVLGVFQKEYDAFVSQGAAWFARHPEAHRLSYVLLGGRQDGGGFAFRFYASEAHGQPYAPLSTAGGVLTAPRRLGLETRLARALAAGAQLGEIEELVTVGLKRIEEKIGDVGGPFDLARITPSGVELAEWA